MVDQLSDHQSTNAPASTPATTTTAAATKRKENPYAKSEVGKYYRCGELRHKTNKCPKRKQVNMTDYEDKEDKEF